MSQSCAVESCESTLGILCHCCEKSFCLDHLDEHYESINAQLKPLANEINALTDQIMKKTKEKLIGNSLEKLNRWRDESFQIINNLYEKKRQELEQNYAKKTSQQRKELDQMQSKLTKLIHENDSTQEDIHLFNSTIQTIKQQLKQIHKTYFEINIRSLEFFDHFISIEETKTDEIDFTILLSPYKTIDCIEYSGRACATNDKLLLIHQNSELQLIDKDSTVMKRFSWENTVIYHMCWSSALESFIVLTYNKGIYLINQDLTSVERIQIDPEQNWWRCCTCSDTSLYLVSSKHYSDIFQFDLLSSFQLIKRWKPSYLCKENDTIVDIAYQNETFALLISNQYKTRMELRSSTTLDRIWSLQLDINYGIRHSTTHCCSLNCNDWLVLDNNNSRLLHVSQNGEIRSISVYNPSPTNAILVGSNLLAIKTDKSWNFHEI